MENQNDFKKQVKAVYHIMVLLFCFLGIILVGFAIYLNEDNTSSIQDNYVVTSAIEEDEDKIENGIHVRTGFVDAEGLMEVVNNCTSCHSAKLVTQNNMSKKRWIETIRWMQETQNLWDLGRNEAVIVNYLATNYAPKDKGRRENLTNIEWYVLE